MRLTVLLGLLIGMLPGIVFAKDADTLVKLASADQARAWEAVGRVNLIGTGFFRHVVIFELESALIRIHDFPRLRRGEVGLRRPGQPVFF